jgi:hypothetical protein
MDPVTISTSAVALLAPHIPAIITGVVEGVASRIPEGVTKLWRKIADRFKDTPTAQSAIEDLQKDPTDQDNLASFRKELRKMIEADPKFAEELHELVETIPHGDIIVQNQKVIHSTVQGSVVQIGKHSR